MNPANSYRVYAFTDWDAPLFGGGIDPDSDCLGVAPPNYRVDGHVVLEADGTGNCIAIEATGSYSGWLGQSFPISFQFSGWWCNPGYPATSDTRHDWNSQFLNIVADPVDVSEPTNATPISASISLVGSTVAISWSSETNRNYRLMWSSQMTNGALWYFLGTALAGNGATNTILDSLTNSSRFYRIISVE